MDSTYNLPYNWIIKTLLQLKNHNHRGTVHFGHIVDNSGAFSKGGNLTIQVKEIQIGRLTIRKSGKITIRSIHRRQKIQHHSMAYTSYILSACGFGIVSSIAYFKRLSIKSNIEIIFFASRSSYACARYPIWPIPRIVHFFQFQLFLLCCMNKIDNWVLKLIVYFGIVSTLFLQVHMKHHS